jgi:hypothetical protein
MVNSDNYNAVQVVKDWPHDASGNPKKPDQLSRDEINGLFGPIEGLDQDDAGKDVAFDVKREVNDSFDNLSSHAK